MALPGLIQKLSQGGLSEHVASWVGTGKNMPVSSEQIQSVLGSTDIQAIASRIGVDKATVSNGLASLLPQLVDKLTPHGQVPDSGTNLSSALAGLSNLFGK